MSQEFTIEELAKCNGVDDSRVYVALKGLVYDVSSGASFYGPGGGYHMFAGKDVSRCLAKMSFEASEMNRADLGDLTPEEYETLYNWISKFESKYPKVGIVKL